MHFYNYLQYYFFLANNWDYRIATHIIGREIKGEKKYQIRTTGADELTKLEEKGIDISHANIYMPASFDLLEDVFSNLPIATYQHFIDIGCGKGRALCVAAAFGSRKLTGIEFSKSLSDEAKLNLLKTKQKSPAINFKIINNDAFYYEIPDDADCIFMFNPFDEIIMSGVLHNIEESLEKHPRKMTIIYLNPMHKHLFLEQGYKEIYHYIKLIYMEAVVLTKSPGVGQGL